MIEDKLLRDKTPESFDRVFGTKVDSALTLARKLDPAKLKFFALFASITSRYGNRGQSDYAAANEVLSKLACDLDRKWPGRVVSVAWGPWAEVGMVADLEKHLVARGLKLIEPAVGAGFAVDEVIFGAKGEPEVLVAGGSEQAEPAAAQAAAPAEAATVGSGVTHGCRSHMPPRLARRRIHARRGTPTSFVLARRRPRRTCASAALALADARRRATRRSLSRTSPRRLAANFAPAGRGSRSSPLRVPICSRSSAAPPTASRDPKCQQIRDAAGVYFFDQPLSAQGSLALLFPGEGAQYPNMLADLCGVFPEVEETFAWCDRLAAEAGRAVAAPRASPAARRRPNGWPRPRPNCANSGRRSSAC